VSDPAAGRVLLDNRDIAAQLDAVADMLVARGAPNRRSKLYRRGAAALRVLGRPVALILHTEGLAGLIRLPGIGEKLARAVRRAATTGQLPILERLQTR
jgi:DNA polymerase/3'-5' exonuclease PolX